MNKPDRLSASSITGIIIFAWLSITTAHADRFDELLIHTWETKQSSTFFPETDDPRVSVDWLKNRPSFGIAFSGGGTRSASATLGQLRALKLLGWLDKARYIAANSGGSWTVIPYIYLPKQFDPADFLGRYTAPEQINDAVLKPDNKTDQFSMSSAIYRSNISTRIAAISRGDETYAKVLGSIFLKPFDLNDRKKLFTFHNKALQSVLDANEDLKATDFYQIARKQPYPIIVGSLYVPLKNQLESSELYLIETTPLYTGVRNEFTVSSGKPKQPKTMLIGGGYVESFGYDSYEPKQDEAIHGLWKVRLEGMLSRYDLRVNKRYRYTLSDVIAMSGAAPAIIMANKNIHSEIFPEFRHWPINRKKVNQDKNIRTKAKELKHGDGGDIDNLALMPLLSRKVENILVFINTRTAFPKTADCNHITTDIMVDDLISLFQPTDKLIHNVVIDQSNGNKLRQICQQFTKLKKAGAALVYCDRYQIKDNFRLAVSGSGYQPAICWVYLDRSEQWIKKINPQGGKKTAQLKQGTADFDTFPHYQTFAEKKVSIIDLDRERVHALSNLAAWSVLTSQDYLATHLSGAL